MAAGLIVRNANGLSAVVTITRVGGGAASVYSDVDCTAAVTIPATITADSTYYLKQPDIYAVSVLVGTTECGPAGGTMFLPTVTPKSGATPSAAVVIDDAETLRAAGAGGLGGSATSVSVATYDAKGDLLVGTGNDAYSKLAVGANNTVLTADSTTATGTKWATPSSGVTAAQAIGYAIIFGGI